MGPGLSASAILIIARLGSRCLRQPFQQDRFFGQYGIEHLVLRPHDGRQTLARMGKSPDRIVTSLAISPDGRRLLFALFR
jgi:hypothetical protein